MNEKMTLLFARETGHVLALLTRAADADAPATPLELTGGALVVRYVGDTKRPFTPDARFFVPADELGAETVDFDAGVLSNPRAFSLDEDKNVQPLDLTQDVTEADPPAGSATQIEVKVDTAVPEDAPVWLHITDGDPARTQTRTGKIPSGDSGVVINVAQLASGDYFVLALVAGFPPNSFSFNVP